MTNNVDDGFPWVFGGVGIVDNFLVGRLEVELPSCVYVGWGAVVDSFKNLKADVPISCWVCIFVEQLDVGLVML